MIWQINVYTYVGGNPLSGSDRFGLWNTDTHNRLFQLALEDCGVSADVIAEIQAESAAWDEATGLGIDGANYHSMAMPGQNSLDAIAARDAFVAAQLDYAKTKYSMLDPSYYINFARAAHALQDSTSPAHVDPDGVPYVWPTPWNAPLHGDSPLSIETWNNMTPNLQTRNIDMTRDLWQKMTGKNCSCQKN